MALTYNPLKAPDPNRWLALDEAIRLRMIVSYHRKKRFDLPNERIHAAIHMVVENQVAMGDETPVAATLDRLMHEALDRHDAIHAIGSVLAGRMWEMSRSDDDPQSDPNELYFNELAELTAQGWIEEYSEQND
jgi:hypothetical protein